MKVFISFSGKISRNLGTVLHTQIPNVLSGIELYMSKHDIESGARWSEDIATELEDTNFGILVVTPYNLESTWLHFEAGALSKHRKGRACALLFGDVKKTDISGPLAQFQHRTFDREELGSLLLDLNKLSDTPSEDTVINNRLEMFWPKIFDECTEALKKSPDNPVPAPPRDDDSKLDEILTILREMQNESIMTSNKDSLNDQLQRITELFSHSQETLPNEFGSKFWDTLSMLARDDKMRNVLMRETPSEKDLDNLRKLSKLAREGKMPDIHIRETPSGKLMMHDDSKRKGKSGPDEADPPI